MKKLAWFLALLPALAWADAPFDGTWTVKMDTFKVSGKPDTYLLVDGIYTCDACVPGLKIKADGTDQKVSGHAYYDTASARIVDAQSVEIKTSRAGKPVGKRTLTVSADGKTLTEDFVSYDSPTPISGKLVSKRVAPARQGAHVLSGSWMQQTEGTTFSAEMMSVTYQQTQTGLTMTSPTGQSYDAKFDGMPVPMVGDQANTMVSLKRINSHTIQETDTRDGKVTDLSVFTVSADGKSLHIVDQDKEHGTTTSMMAEKK